MPAANWPVDPSCPARDRIQPVRTATCTVSVRFLPFFLAAYSCWPAASMQLQGLRGRLE